MLLLQLRLLLLQGRPTLLVLLLLVLLQRLLLIHHVQWCHLLAQLLRRHACHRNEIPSLRVQRSLL